MSQVDSPRHSLRVGEPREFLRVDGTNVINAATSPRSHRSIGVFLFDKDNDGVTDLSAPDPNIFALPFLTGVDHFVAAQIPTRGTVAILVTPRGQTRATRLIRFPRTASTVSAISVVLRDFEGSAAPRRGLSRRE